MYDVTYPGIQTFLVAIWFHCTSLQQENACLSAFLMRGKLKNVFIKIHLIKVRDSKSVNIILPKLNVYFIQITMGRISEVTYFKAKSSPLTGIYSGLSLMMLTRGNVSFFSGKDSVLDRRHSGQISFETASPDTTDMTAASSKWIL